MQFARSSSSLIVGKWWKENRALHSAADWFNAAGLKDFEKKNPARLSSSRSIDKWKREFFMRTWRQFYAKVNFWEFNSTVTLFSVETKMVFRSRMHTGEPPTLMHAMHVISTHHTCVHARWDPTENWARTQVALILLSLCLTSLIIDIRSRLPIVWQTGERIKEKRVKCS